LTISTLAGRMLLIALAFWLAGIGIGHAQNTTNLSNAPVKRVLMLFSEGRESAGSLMLEQSLRTEMLKETTNNLEFYVEHLDAGRFSDQSHFRLFQDYLGKKYAGQHLDLILAIPSRNYLLAEQLPGDLFPNVPVVFVTVNELEVPHALHGLEVTGIIQRFDLRGTLALMLRLQPDTRHIVVIGGTSNDDRATLARISEMVPTLEGIEFEFWTNRPVMDLPEAVKKLPDGTAILLSTIQRDVTGRPYFMSQLAQLLAPSANVPLYVLGAAALGSGAVGGAVVDPEDLGVRTAKLATRVLNGAPPASVAIEVDTKGTQMVDWHALQRWHIKDSRVPPDCNVRFRPETLWAEHRYIILAFLAVFVAQALTIAGLLTQRRQRRLAEIEVLNQRTELAHVSRVSTMGQLSSALAHELNQPLGAILRNAEAGELFLQKEKPDLDEIRAIFADIRKDDERAGNVINRMRSLLKRRSLESDPLDLQGLIEETITLARPDAVARRIHLSLRVAPELPLVLGDRVHLQQVLLNLMLNGMDAMSACRTADRVLSVVARMAGNDIEVVVKDRGTGIPADKVERVFEAFFTTKSDGMGMGLAISRTIIEAHGEKIRAENNPDKGASFIFTLKPAV
jgi:signal transduction histidine kinase/ABC-type uncharacterized transport system substrate-binding protein